MLSAQTTIVESQFGTETKTFLRWAGAFTFGRGATLRPLATGAPLLLTEGLFTIMTRYSPRRAR